MSAQKGAENADVNEDAVGRGGNNGDDAVDEVGESAAAGERDDGKDTKSGAGSEANNAAGDADIDADICETATGSGCHDDDDAADKSHVSSSKN